MIPSPSRPFVPGLLVLGAVALLAGCAEDTVIGGETAISGRVVDPGGTGIPGVGVGVEYTSVAVASGSLLPGAASAAGVALLSPYPNPATGAVEGDEIRIPIQVSTDTTLDVSILSPSSGVYRFEREIFSGLVTRDTTFRWNGRGGDGLLPNGLYRVRLTVPADPPAGVTPTVIEAPVLINRSPALLEALLGFNANSDPGGGYLIGDLAVGQRIQATNAQGTSLGTQRIVEPVYLIFRSPDYQPEETQVFIAPGDFVTVTTTLTPIFPAAVPALAGAP